MQAVKNKLCNLGFHLEIRQEPMKHVVNISPSAPRAEISPLMMWLALLRQGSTSATERKHPINQRLMGVAYLNSPEIPRARAILKLLVGNPAFSIDNASYISQRHRIIRQKDGAPPVALKVKTSFLQVVTNIVGLSSNCLRNFFRSHALSPKGQGLFDIEAGHILNPHNTMISQEAM